MIYRACLCFSGEQAAAAVKLRRALDAWRTPAPLVGLAGANGPVPSRVALTPLDNVEVFPGGQLSEDVEAKLSACDGLIVLCSPATASDIAISRAIDRFFAFDRTRRVFAVIAPDAPDTNEVERDFLPPALLGRGPVTADLRDIKRANGVLIGDGFEAGLLRLNAALLGVSIARLSDARARGLRSTTAGLSVLSLVLAGAAVAGLGFSALAAHNAYEAEHSRQAALQRANEAAQQGQQANAAREAEAAARQHAAAAADAERTQLRDGVQSLLAQANGALDVIGESQAASSAALRQLRAVEDATRKIGEAGWVFGAAPETIVGLWEKLANTYAAIGRADDAQHVKSRFSQFNLRLAQNDAADPAWRAAYAARLAGLYNARLEKDRPGALAALEEAARIDTALCDAHALDATRTNACLAQASLELRRARSQEGAQEPVDSAALTRARTMLETALAAASNNAPLQTGAPPLRDQIDRMIARQQASAQN